MLPGTTWRPSPTGGLSTAAAGCADAALNRTPDTAPAPGAGFGRGGRSDADGSPPADPIPPSLGAPAVRMDGGAPGEIEDETKTVCQVFVGK